MRPWLGMTVYRVMSWLSLGCFGLVAAVQCVTGPTWFGAATLTANAWGFLFTRNEADRYRRIIERAKGDPIEYA